MKEVKEAKLLTSPSEVPVHTRATWPMTDWFHPLHTSTWFMDNAQCRVLYNLRSKLLEYVRGGDANAVEELLNSEVKEVVETSGGISSSVALKAPVKIEYYDATLPLAIEEAIALGLPNIVRLLCNHAVLDLQHTTRYVKTARERESIMKQLYAKTPHESQEDVVEAERAYHSAEHAIAESDRNKNTRELDKSHRPARRIVEAADEGVVAVEKGNRPSPARHTVKRATMK